MTDTDNKQSRIEELEHRLAALDEERKQIAVALQRLRQSPANPVSQEQSGSLARSSRAPVTAASSSADKITLFRSLFRGREDVFPRRWLNDKTRKSGYAPVCSNEWARGICQKPKIKCSECPNQAFVPIRDEAVRRQLQGTAPSGLPPRSAEFTIGVYPLLQDETCRFLAADFDKQSW